MPFSGDHLRNAVGLGRGVNDFWQVSSHGLPYVTDESCCLPLQHSLLLRQEMQQHKASSSTSKIIQGIVASVTGVPALAHPESLGDPV